MDVRHLSRDFGIATMYELLSTYPVGNTVLSRVKPAHELATELIRRTEPGWDALNPDNFPADEAIQIATALGVEMETISGICLMSVVATGNWHVLKQLCLPITDPGKYFDEGWGAEYLPGMVLGILESLAWLYVPLDGGRHYFVEHGNRYALYPPDFLADVLTSSAMNEEGIAENHRFFGLVSNLVPFIIDGPSQEEREEHWKMLDNMLWRIHDGLRKLGKESNLVSETTDKLVIRYFLSQDQKSRRSLVVEKTNALHYAKAPG